MNNLFNTRLARTLLAVCLAGAAIGAQAAAPEPAPQPAALPGDSVYQLTAGMTDQDGRAFKLKDRRGQPVLVSMFYNTCKFVCPMLVDSMRLTEQALSADERARLGMLLITFDPARDSVKSLKSVTMKRDLAQPHWTLARTDAASVRKIAASLDIQYRLLGDGEYNHTTVLILLDADGRIVGRTRKLGSADPAFVKLIQETLKQAPAPLG